MVKGRGVCLIAGAGPGIGQAVARRFAREGFRVVAVRRNKELLQSLTEEIEKTGGECQARGCDVRREEQVEDLIAEVTILYWPKNIYPIFPKKDTQKFVL